MQLFIWFPNAANSLTMLWAVEQIDANMAMLSEECLWEFTREKYNRAIRRPQDNQIVTYLMKQAK